MFVFSPVHDLGNNVEFDSVYQSVHRQAGITFSRSDFPLGFFVVLIVRPGTWLGKKKSRNKVAQNVTYTFVNTKWFDTTFLDCNCRLHMSICQNRSFLSKENTFFHNTKYQRPIKNRKKMVTNSSADTPLFSVPWFYIIKLRCECFKPFYAYFVIHQLYLISSLC